MDWNRLKDIIEAKLEKAKADNTAMDDVEAGFKSGRESTLEMVLDLMNEMDGGENG